MTDFLTVSVLLATLASGIRLATPFLLAALGETLSQRSGVLNLGVEGVMLLGAYGAYYATLRTDSVVLGILVSLVVGGVMGVVYGVVTLALKAEQGISGIGIFIFGLGLSDLLFQKQVGTPTPIDGLGDVALPLLGDLPLVGEVLFHQNILVYVAFLLVPVLWFVVNRTPFGLNVRAVGETPEAADSLGVSVNRTRYITIFVGNAMAGLAGGALALELGIFQQNLTNGHGFIAIALVYFGAWRPTGVMAGAMVFGLVSATVLQWKTLGIVVGTTASIVGMFPAVLTILVLVLVSRRTGQPSALTRPFERGH
ncbi:MAG: ABC transporter permease [bacterium]|nr:ABC transporter permease [bacterium]